MRRSLTIVVAMLFATSLAAVIPAARASAAQNERAVILSPYASASTFASAGQEPDVHAGRGDWAVDVYDGEAAIYPNIIGATGALTMRATVSNSCGTTGKIVTVSVSVDGVKVGTVNYVHLDNVNLPANGVVTSTTRLGTTKLWTPSVQYDGTPPNTYLCWQVSSLTGVHVHMAAFGGSCYAGIKGGSPLAKDQPIGALGTGIAAGSECSDAQLALSKTPVIQTQPPTTSGPNAVSDGYLFMSAIGDDGKLYYRYRSESSNAWGKTWASRGAPTGVKLQGSPSLAVSDGYLFMSAIGDDGKLYYRYRSESSNAWGKTWASRGAPTGVKLQGSPSLAVSDGYLFMSAIGDDGKLYYRYRSESSNAWGKTWASRGAPTGVKLQGSPSLAVSDGYLFMSAIGDDGKLYYRYRSESSNAWGKTWASRGAPTGVKLQGSPSLAVSDGYLFMSAIGDDGKLYYRYRSESSNAWGKTWASRGAPTGVKLQGSPSLAVSDGYLFMSAIGDDGKLYYRYRSESSNAWGKTWASRGAPTGVKLQGSPSLAVSDGYLFMSAIGDDGKLYYRYRSESSNAWGKTWASRGAPTGVKLA